MKNTLKKILFLLLAVFVIAQFFGPEKNDGDLVTLEPFLAETNPPEDVKLILKETCFDCHSSVTRYPWYSKITPVNYWLNDHIEHGKEELDFSKWESYSAKKKEHKLDEVGELVEKKEMPLESYTWVHKEAKLSDAQIEAVVAWVNKVKFKYSLEPRPE
ncbi:heme-binding domain-containing protein [Mangrovimonas spongiae]|uniref:Cytochrome C n=1 Tax=Mangrovimonas spongiae TaxID=2494697 RepID=A0A3R9USS0_9FLAO|nr:heme-binding domain-containing protein [Mangrovimonas spongiae]RSK39351.1 cytochrome C [Mangrovimonas spongiae]